MDAVKLARVHHNEFLVCAMTILHSVAVCMAPKLLSCENVFMFSPGRSDVGSNRKYVSKRSKSKTEWWLVGEVLTGSRHSMKFVWWISKRQLKQNSLESAQKKGGEGGRKNKT